MDFLQLAKQRYSSRKYLNKTVEEEKLLSVLEAARIAPTAANKQPFLIYVIREEKNRQLLCSCYHREWLREAPVIMVICVDHSKAWVRAADQKDHGNIDAAIVGDHMTLEATALGLATCWICNFDPFILSDVLSLPENVEPVALMPLVYPADKTDPQRHATTRKKLDEIVKWEF
jgi:nitroreductase